MPVYPGALEFLCLSITVVQFLFTTLTSLFVKKCNRLKARVVIYAYDHHVGSFLPSLRSSDNRSLLGSRSRHCYAIICVHLNPRKPRLELR